tara:strand:+ start:398 stop:682 length:285 start_codon:yes stop_codon:yes gene_type:complete
VGQYVRVISQRNSALNAGGNAYPAPQAREQFDLGNAKLDDEEMVGIVWVKPPPEGLPRPDCHEELNIFYVARPEPKRLKAHTPFSAPSAHPSRE